MQEFGKKAREIKLDATSESSDTLLDDWMNEMGMIIDEFAPLQKMPMRKRRVPWITDDVRGLMTKRNAAATRIKHGHRSNEDIERLKSLRRKTKSHLRRAKKNYGFELLQTNKMSDAWKFLREITFTVKKGEKGLVDAAEVNEYFATTVTAAEGDTPLRCITGCDNNDCFTWKELETHEIEDMLKDINGRTGTGCDNLPGQLLKQIARDIAPNLKTIMNASFTSGTFPNLWKRANVTAVWKAKGSMKDPANYRPISVLPILARSFERVCATQLYQYCTDHNIIPRQQFGFRAGSNCELALLSANEYWMGSVDKGNVAGALMIDLSKAFDTVPHQELLQQLMETGCSLNVIKFFESYLTERKQRVISCPIVTEWRMVTRGVPQGGGLSPLLYNIYGRELPGCSKSMTHQFADDTTLSDSDKSPQVVAERLTASFNNIKSWCTKKQLIINAEKTQFIVFKSCKKKLPENYSIVLDGVTIKPSTSVKLLGVMVDQHLTYACHIDAVKKKCMGLLGILSRSSKEMPRELRKLTYISLIRSQLEYSSAIFAGAAKTHLLKLDMVQKIASRIITQSPRNAHSAPLQDMLGLVNLNDRRRQHIIKLVEKMIAGKSHPEFNELFDFNDEGLYNTLDNPNSRIKIGDKRFSIFATNIFNNRTDIH